MKMDADLAQSHHRKSEKISALAALLGAETMDRLRQRHPEFGSTGGVSGTADAGRVAWQRNRLLDKIRADLDGAPAADPHGRSGPDDPARRDPGHGNASDRDKTSVDAHIAAGLSLANLRHEHPAVIARVLRGLDRTARVSLLQQLPGHAARAALRRLRSLQQPTGPERP